MTDAFSRYTQRGLDVFLSGLALAVLSPLMCLVVILLRITGEGEVFFVQQRIGLAGRMFGLLKFATMLKDSPNIGSGTLTVKDDPRVLPFGRFLRASKINELPQLINIFKGDMSLIGPRPQTQRCFDVFLPSSQEAIIRVRPGLSGVGSIVFRSEADITNASPDPSHFYDTVVMPYKGLLEEWFVENRTVRTYLICLALTLWVIVFPRSRLVWGLLPGLPAPPPALRTPLGFSSSARESFRIRQVARLHQSSLSSGFLRTLGVPFLTLMYESMEEAGDAFLITEERGEQVIGFITGGMGMRGTYRRMLRHPLRLSLVLGPSLIRPMRLARILEIVRYGSSSTPELPKAEMLTFAVRADFRGKGVAEGLYRRALEEFRRRGVDKIRLNVGASLITALRFYHRMGAYVAGEVTFHKGKRSIVLIQEIPPRP